MADRPRTIAILYPGEMGGAVAACCTAAGIGVTTLLAGRSAETSGRAIAAGMEEAGGLEDLVAGAELVLSIVPPGIAVATAKEIAAAMRATGATPPFMDCNAVSPATAQEVRAAFSGLDVPVIDAGIIGPPPGPGKRTQFYVSGEGRDRAAFLAETGIGVTDLGGEYGRASAMKMVYASMTKGTNALLTCALLTADRLGILDETIAELDASQPGFLKRVNGVVPRLPADSLRYADEMGEIARTYAAAGLTPNFHLGAQDLMTLLAATSFASETRQSMDKSRTMEDTIRQVSAQTRAGTGTRNA